MQPGEDDAAGGGEGDVGDGPAGEDEDCGPEGAAGAVDVGEAGGGVALFGEGAEGAGAAVDAGEADGDAAGGLVGGAVNMERDETYTETMITTLMKESKPTSPASEATMTKGEVETSMSEPLPRRRPSSEATSRETKSRPRM